MGAAARQGTARMGDAGTVRPAQPLGRLHKKRRCRRHRTCCGDQFDCYWEYREKLSPAERARDDARFAPLQALLNIGPEYGE